MTGALIMPPTRSGITEASMTRKPSRLWMRKFGSTTANGSLAGPILQVPSVTRRVEVAKEKLRNTGLSLSDIALACGFGDQSHLTRVFTRMVGVSPGAWRRALDQ
jgi:AraC-like DNA-binding protein